MARIRSIKPAFFTSEDVCKCRPLARLLFQGLWCEADREGRLEDRPIQIKMRVLPADECDVDALLWELADATLIRRYRAADAHDYIQILAFKEHQRPHPKEPASTIPADGEDRKPCFSTASREKDSVHPGDFPSSPVGMDKEYGVSDPDRSTGGGSGNGSVAAVAAAPLIVSPLAYERKLQHCAYVGARLEVPKVLHGELRKALGGSNAEADLMAWYADLDADLEQSGESLPDVWAWLRGRFKAWDVATSRAAAVPVAPKPTKARPSLEGVIARLDGGRS